jgi:uracil-DNA glycosylase
MEASDPRADLAELVGMAAELLRWERGLGMDAVAPGEPRTAASPSHTVPQRPDAPPAATPVATPPAAPTEPRPAGPLRDPEDMARALAVLAEEAAQCTACGLHRSRTHSVFARGAPSADLVFVGEGPGYHEDQQGLPFVGPAGQLLDRMVAAMGYGRDDVYICNVVKCRPPENRTPLPNEASACERFLRSQLEIVAPRVIVALGRCAAENLGCAGPAGGRWRGQWGTYQGIPVMPTYHPAFLLRSPQFKRPVWEDLQQVLARLGRASPA